MNGFVLLKVIDDEPDVVQADTQNYSLSTGNNEVSIEQPPTAIDTQNTLPSTNVK